MELYKIEVNFYIKFKYTKLKYTRLKYTRLEQNHNHKFANHNVLWLQVIHAADDSILYTNAIYLHYLNFAEIFFINKLDIIKCNKIKF